MVRNLCVAAAVALSVVGSAAVPRDAVFPVERLSPAARALAEDLLLQALDGEALYTIVGGLKPMSSGWGRAVIEVDDPAVAEAERLREAMAAIRVGDEFAAFLAPFHRVYDGRRTLHAYLVHRDAFRGAVRANPDLFGYFGHGPLSDPALVVSAIDADGSSRRSRAYGVLFGYPTHAVDFFVRAEEHQAETGEFVERDFVSIPTYAAETNRFVYAVPRGHEPNEEDRLIREAAEPILAYYRYLRPKYIGEGRPGVVALLRDWFDDGTGMGSSETALSKAREFAARDHADALLQTALVR